MDSQFWIKAWNEGKTAFHQAHYDEKLIEYFPQFNSQKGQKVLVPLCGKTKDLLWLHELNLHVHGVELYDQAVKDFFAENELFQPQISQDQNFTHYTHKNIVISCGNFFRLSENETYDFVYDRAALVALPAAMRKNYAQAIKKSLKRDGKYLLIVYEYDPSQMDGPPFSVDEKEIHELYGDQFTIRLMESKKPSHEGSRLSSVESLQHKVYILEKTH